MSKIEASLVVKFLFDIQALVDGIYETIRIGDDGFQDACHSQVKEIHNAIQLFILTNATTRKPKEVLPGYVLAEAQLHADPEWNQSPRNYQESMVLYKARLFHFIRRNLSAIADLDDLKPESLQLRIENDIILNTPDRATEFQSNELYYTICKVVADVVALILEERKKNMQKVLFD